MRTTTQTTAVAVCLAVLFLQFISCKKDSTGSINHETKDSSLIAWYTFDNDILDHSGNNNNIISSSAVPTTGKKGAANTAYRFDGVSSFMQVANSTSLNPSVITLYALVKPEGFYQGTCHQNRIISKGYNDYDQGRIDLGFDDAAYYNYTGCSEAVQDKYENFFGSYGDGSDATGAKDLGSYVQPDNWYSLVYTFDGVYSKIYVNGVLATQVQQSTSFSSNSNPLFIGRNQDPNYPYYFNGIIDEVRIYKRVLSETEVAELSKN